MEWNELEQLVELPFASLRRHDPDQVPRVFLRPAFDGSPLANRGRIGVGGFNGKAAGMLLRGGISNVQSARIKRKGRKSHV